MAVKRDKLSNMDSRKIMNYFPGEPRQIQREVLELLEKKWDNYDVFVLILPVATGKSNIAVTLADWRFFADIITPTNILMEQYLRDFPKFPVVFRKSWYECCRKHFWGGKVHPHKDCQYTAAQRRVRAVPRGLMNYYMYMALSSKGRKTAPTLIIDEAHNCVSTIQELNGKKMWQHDWHYPDWVRDSISFKKWMEGRKSVTTLDQDEKDTLQFCIDQINSSKPQFIFQRTRLDWSKGKESELRDCIVWKPIDISKPKTGIWKYDTEKLILLSATLSKKDIEALGLNRKRVLIIQGHSPIPKENRPVYMKPVAFLNYATLEQGTEKIAKYIESELLERHKGEKGVIHATYKQAEILKRHLGSNPRFIWHTARDKQQRYADFLESPAEEGKVLVASGLYEGIDLPGDLGRWQVVTKVPWMSLADPATKWKAEQDKEWYDWECLKIVIQASGRVCRTPTDFGLTYILDGTIIPLYERNKNSLPEWFCEAVEVLQKG